MKILLITPLYPGYINQSAIEATYVVHHLARQWAKTHEIKVVRLWPHYPKVFNFVKKSRKMAEYSYMERFTLDQVNVLRVPIKKIPKFRYTEKELNRIVDLIKDNLYSQNGPDIIICDTLDPSIYIGDAVSRIFDSTLIASLHNTDIKHLSNQSNYRRFMGIESNIDKIAFRSTVVEKKFLNLYTGTRRSSDNFNILFGLDESVFITEKELEIKPSYAKKEIIVAASLKKLKKIDVLIKAFVDMKNKDEYILRIIGEGPERKMLEDLVDSINCKTQIIFEGEKTRNEVLNIMEHAEIFAMVSSPETFGLVYLEAMAKGCITIGSKHEGIDGVIVNNENGFLCTPNDVKDLKDVLDRISKMGLADKRRILSNAYKTAKNYRNESLAENYIKQIQRS